MCDVVGLVKGMHFSQSKNALRFNLNTKAQNSEVEKIRRANQKPMLYFYGRIMIQDYVPGVCFLAFSNLSLSFLLLML